LRTRKHWLIFTVALNSTCKRPPVPVALHRGQAALHEAEKRLYLHQRTGFDVVTIVVQHNETVGSAHRVQQARSGGAGGAHLQDAAVASFQDGAVVLNAAWFFTQPCRRGHVKHRFGRNMRFTSKCAQSAAHKLIERHHDGYRITRKSEKGCIVDASECEWPAGADGNFPKTHFAERLQHGLHEVRGAGRNPT